MRSRPWLLWNADDWIRSLICGELLQQLEWDAALCKRCGQPLNWSFAMCCNGVHLQDPWGTSYLKQWEESTTMQVSSCAVLVSTCIVGLDAWCATLHCCLSRLPRDVRVSSLYKRDRHVWIEIVIFLGVHLCSVVCGKVWRFCTLFDMCLEIPLGSSVVLLKHKFTTSSELLKAKCRDLRDCLVLVASGQQDDAVGLQRSVDVLSITW